jgi:hypothetical protein
MTATIFYKHLKAFTKHVLNGRVKPIGEVKDWFMKFEWQERRAVHVHMLVWAELGVDVELLQQSPKRLLALAEIIDVYITTLFPGESAPVFVPKEPNESDEGEQLQPDPTAGHHLNPTEQQLPADNIKDKLLIDRVKNHPASFFSPQLPLSHPTSQDYLKKLLNRFQVHDCELHKQGKPCGFPKDPVATTNIQTKHTNTKTRMHVNTQ